MEHSERSSDTEIPEEEVQLFVYPVNKLDIRAPFRWLAKGWGDIRRAPLFSLSYGSAIVLIGYLVTWLVYGGENTTILFTIGIGLILIGPVLAFGLYSISRQIENGKEPQFGRCFKESSNHMRNELLFVLILLVILLIWARAASMVHVFFPVSEDLGIAGWLQFLAVGSAVGSIFATMVFVSSAFSLPLMLDKNTDAITSALTSINAVLKNKLVMLIWVSLIIGLVVLGLATAYLGLIVILPLIGHATWHAYRETILSDPGLFVSDARKSE